jgi:hypothetical protein
MILSFLKGKPEIFYVKLHGLAAMASFNAGSRSLPWSGIPPEGHSSTPSRVWPSGCGVKFQDGHPKISNAKFLDYTKSA